MTPDRSKAPETKAFGYLSMPSESVQELPNGIVLHSFRGGDQPIANLSLSIGGGQAEHGDSAAKILATTITEGSANLSSTEINDIVDFNGVRLGGRAQQHFCVIEAAMLSHRMTDFMPVFAEIIGNATFPADRVDIAKRRFADIFQTRRQNIANLAEESAAQLIYGLGHPLTSFLSEADIDQIDSEMLANLHSRMMCRGGVHAYLSGNFSDASFDAAVSALSALPLADGQFALRIEAFNPAAPASRIETPFDSHQCAFNFVLPAIPRDNPDYVPLRMATVALGGYFGSRLMTNIREEKGLTYGIRADLLGTLDGSHIAITAQCDKSKAELAEAEITKEMLLLATEPPCGDELTRLKLYLSTNLAEILDTPAGIMGYYATQRLVGTPPDYFDAQQRIIANLTPDLIAETATKYLQPALMRKALAGPVR